MNSDGQSPFSPDGIAVLQTQPSPDRPTPTLRQTWVKTRSWFETLTEKNIGGNYLLELSKTLLVTNFSAAIAMVTVISQGSLLQLALNSNLPPVISVRIVVASIAISFTCSMHAVILQKKSPIVASRWAYAGVLSFAIAFLTTIQMILPLTVGWIVWPAGVSIFLSSLYVFRKNRVDTKDETVLFYWRKECVSGDHEGVVKALKKGTTLLELKAMIKPMVAPNGENGEDVRLKFEGRIPYQESPELKYALVAIDNDEILNYVLNLAKESPPKFSLQFYVSCEE